MNEYITKQEFKDFKKALFKYLQEAYEMKPKPPQIPKPLEEKLNTWTNRSNKSLDDTMDKIIDGLPFG